MNARNAIAVEVVLDEDPDHTDATATVTVRGTTFTGQGRARRNPADPNVPMIGEELATARALADLSHKLLEAAAEAIGRLEGRPPHLAG
jgi:hypothetical protein